MHIYTNTCRIHTDAIIKTSEDFLKNIILTLLKGFEKGYSKFYCERELETEQNCNILTSLLMTISVVSFSFSRVAQPEARGPRSLLGAGFSTTSYLQLVWSPKTDLISNCNCTIGGLRAHSAGCWLPLYRILSLTHLISN